MSNKPSLGGRGGADATQAIGTPVEPEHPDVFLQDQVLEYHVTLSPEEREHLEEHGNDEVYLSGQLTVKGADDEMWDLGEVGFRHKGAYSLHHCWDDNGGVRSYEDECAKLSYKIKFNEFDDGSRFDGLKKLNLHSSSTDPTKLRELLAYDLYNSFGIVGPRVGIAKLVINGEIVGLFLSVEAIDGRFTASRFPDSGDGNLYKEIWPRPDTEDAYFLEGLKTNEDPEDPSPGWPFGKPDVSDMQAFSAALLATSADTFAADMAEHVDLEHTLRYMAVDRAIKNWDGVTGFYSEYSPHNFYWYHDDAPESPFLLVPWDLDNTFAESDPFTQTDQVAWLPDEPLPEWNTEVTDCTPLPVWFASVYVYPMGCDKFHQLLASTQWSGFEDHGRELLQGPFALDVMTQKLDSWAGVMEPLVEDDPTLSLGEWKEEVTHFKGTLGKIRRDFEALLDAGYIQAQAPVE